MKELMFENMEAGIKYFRNVLEELEGRIITMTDIVNNGKHYIITTDSNETYYILFKKYPFMEWIKYYTTLGKLQNIIKRVDSINLDIFKKNIFDNKKIKYIFIIYGDGKIIKIDKNEWWKRANDNHLFREILEEQHINSNDFTGSIKHENNFVTSCYFIKEDFWF